MSNINYEQYQPWALSNEYRERIEATIGQIKQAQPAYHQSSVSWSEHYLFNFIA